MNFDLVINVINDRYCQQISRLIPGVVASKRAFYFILVFGHVTRILFMCILKLITELIK